ncbi:MULTISPECIES: hypothetical protein [unclassified Nostoc]|nr:MULTISPECIES: hypothetical protein [unclassified Nostoc]
MTLMQAIASLFVLNSGVVRSLIRNDLHVSKRSHLLLKSAVVR